MQAEVVPQFVEVRVEVVEVVLKFVQVLIGVVKVVLLAVWEVSFFYIFYFVAYGFRNEIKIRRNQKLFFVSHEGKNDKKKNTKKAKKKAKKVNSFFQQKLSKFLEKK